MEPVLPKEEQTRDDRCRVCLVHTEPEICLRDTVSSKEQLLSYWDILLLISTIETKDNADLPQKICTACAERMETSYDFKVLCEKSDKILQSELTCKKLNICDIKNDIKIEIVENEMDYNVSLKMKDTTNLNTEYILPETSNNQDVSNSSNDEDITNNIGIDLDCPTGNPNEKFVALSCPHCDYETTCVKDLTKHEKIHKGGKVKRRECPFCDADFAYNSTLYQKHLIELHVDENIGCNLCDKLFFARLPLNLHMNQKHPGQTIPLDVCKTCGFTPATRKLFLRHVREGRCKINQNTAEVPKTCEFCDYTNSSAKKLGAHMTLSHDDKKTVRCPMCDKRFFKSGDLSAHMARLHEASTPIVCELCGKNFKSKTNLQQHMDAHNGVKKYECNLCGRKFTRLCLLQRHGQTHAGERNFECGECGVKLKESKTLKRHILAVHKQVKDFHCKLCPKKFAYSSALSIHMRMHMGVRNHKCDVCEKAFFRKPQLLAHQQLHTGERPFECEICGEKFTKAFFLKKHSRKHSGLIVEKVD